MLPAENRLTKLRDFTILMKHGVWLNGPTIALKMLRLEKNKDYLPKKEDPGQFEKQLKIAFTVGIKISKKAVVRNKLKRQMREVVRLLLTNKKLKDGYYLLFVARSGMVEKEYAEISEEMTFLLKKAQVL